VICNDLTHTHHTTTYLIRINDSTLNAYARVYIEDDAAAGTLVVLLVSRSVVAEILDSLFQGFFGIGIQNDFNKVIIIQTI